ncbi:MAG: site-specific integrase, partial [Deltaproteobacteria bacterium]|nr:site-specific integrase [Deltaproteobacteria bacterium]
VTLALNTGMRQGELLKLRWEEVNWDTNSLTFKQPKTLRVKTIPLNEAAKEVITWCDEHRYGDYVLMHHWGEPFQRSTVNKAFKLALKEAGITDCRWNDMRHSFASHLVMAGVDLPTVSELMGHSKITMTMRYTHLAPKHKEEAVARLAERFQRSEGETGQDRKKAIGGVSTPNLAQSRNVSLARKRQVAEISSERGPVLPPGGGVALQGPRSPGSLRPPGHLFLGG